MKNKFEKTSKLQKILLWSAAAAGTAAFLYSQNNRIEITNILYENARIPKSFDNFKIAHISDLHSKRFGLNQSAIIKKLEKISPDIIVITGDLIDDTDNNFKNVMSFINRAVKISSVYYVAGNNEYASGKYSYLRDILIYAGVCVLDDNFAEIIRNGEMLQISGIQDPIFEKMGNNNAENSKIIQNKLSVIENAQKAAYNYLNQREFGFKFKNDTTESENVFKILLSHRPEQFDIYKKNKYDLVFCGHAHGGQIRIPFIGGIFAPNQGYLPKFSEGVHKSGETTMVISRGLGNSKVPLRVFNCPEIVVCVLKHPQDNK